MWRSLEPDIDLGGGDRQALTGPDQDRHVGPAPDVGGEPDRDVTLRCRFRVDAGHLVIAVVLATHRVLECQRA
jgi:hypothetical protein